MLELPKLFATGRGSSLVCLVEFYVPLPSTKSSLLPSFSPSLVPLVSAALRRHLQQFHRTHPVLLSALRASNGLLPYFLRLIVPVLMASRTYYRSWRPLPSINAPGTRNAIPVLRIARLELAIRRSASSPSRFNHYATRVASTRGPLCARKSLQLHLAGVCLHFAGPFRLYRFRPFPFRHGSSIEKRKPLIRVLFHDYCASLE